MKRGEGDYSHYWVSTGIVEDFMKKWVAILKFSELIQWHRND